MSRKADNSHGFSFTRFINNAVPSMMPDSRPHQAHNTMPMPYKDMLYNHQLASPASFYNLDVNSFHVGGVASNARLSKSVFKTLQKYGVLGDQGQVNTHAIGPKFTHQMAILGAPRQRDLINLLFWFEEECQRFRKLTGEDRDLAELIEQHENIVTVANAEGENGEADVASGVRENLDQLKFARERVRMKIRQSPSQRQEEIERDRDDIVGQGFRTKQNVTVSSRTGGTAVEEEVLPDYSTIVRK